MHQRAHSRMRAHANARAHARAHTHSLRSRTLVRSTKDVLVVTAPKSGAEIIPFLKTYVNLPGAIGFTVLYSKLTNKYSRSTVFYLVLSTFLLFFGGFSAFIYPNQAFLHPTGLADALAAALPAGFGAPIAIIRNWTYAVFYTMAELWGSVIVSLLFWGFANEVLGARREGDWRWGDLPATSNDPPPPPPSGVDREGGEEVLPTLRPRRECRAHLLGAVRPVRLRPAPRVAGFFHK